MMTSPPRNSHLLSVGGLDPSGHAGVLADARVFQKYHIPYRAVLTAVTAQSEKKFLGWRPVAVDLFRKQLSAVEGKVFGVKIGMIATPHHARILSKWLQKIKPRHVLWDPVLQSSTGARLLQARRWGPALQGLLECTHVFTPNLPEAEWILGKKISNLKEMEIAAERLHQLAKKGKRCVLLKGGHLPRPSSRENVTDIYFNGVNLKRISARAVSGERRGTGCTLGAAMLAELFRGRGGLDAARRAKRYVLQNVFDSAHP
jgi:hydroxymethylpyrimidine/phosphomethylpyrimidine kinase